MRVALVRKRYTAAGGAERDLDALARAFCAAGDQVEVVAADWHAGEVPYRIRPVRCLRSPSLLRDLSFALAAARVCARGRYDLVLSNDKTLVQDVYRAGDGCHKAWLAARSRVVGPLKRLALRLSPYHALVLWLERRIFDPQRTRAVIAVSRRVKDEVVSLYGYPSERIAVVYNGVDSERFRPLAPEERRARRAELGAGQDDVVALLVGSGFERKGVGLLVRALALAREERLLAWVAGKGRPGGYLRLARSLGVEGRVRFLGVVQGMEGLYGAADVLVAPSVYEPFGNVCLEAMAAGLPVVASAAVGAAELLGEAGLVLPAGSGPEELAGALLRLCDPELRARMGQAARRIARGCTFERTVAGTLEVCRRVAGERGW